MAVDSDNQAAPVGVWRPTKVSSEFLKRLRHLVVPKMSVLDLGCGNGILSLKCAELGAKVYSSDIDAKACAATADMGTRYGYSLEVREGDGLGVWKEYKFDLIVCNAPNFEYTCVGNRFVIRPPCTFYPFPDLVNDLLMKGSQHIRENGSALIGVPGCSRDEILSVYSRRYGWEALNLSDATTSVDEGIFGSCGEELLRKRVLTHCGNDLLFPLWLAQLAPPAGRPYS